MWLPVSEDSLSFMWLVMDLSDVAFWHPALAAFKCKKKGTKEKHGSIILAVLLFIKPHIYNNTAAFTFFTCFKLTVAVAVLLWWCCVSFVLSPFSTQTVPGIANQISVELHLLYLHKHLLLQPSPCTLTQYVQHREEREAVFQQVNIHATVGSQHRHVVSKKRGK